MEGWIQDYLKQLRDMGSEFQGHIVHITPLLVVDLQSQQHHKLSVSISCDPSPTSTDERSGKSENSRNALPNVWQDNKKGTKLEAGCTRYTMFLHKTRKTRDRNTHQSICYSENQISMHITNAVSELILFTNPIHIDWSQSHISRSVTQDENSNHTRKEKTRVWKQSIWMSPKESYKIKPETGR